MMWLHMHLVYVRIGATVTLGLHEVHRTSLGLLNLELLLGETMLATASTATGVLGCA